VIWYGQSQGEAASAAPHDQEIKKMCSFHRRFRSLLTVALATLSVICFPASLEGQGLLGRSQVEVRLGLGVRATSGMTTSGSGIQTETEAAGFLGSVVYACWLNEGLALTGSAGFLSAEAKTLAGTSGFESRSASVFLLFLGARTYFRGSTFGPRWRPYASAELGPIIGSQSWVELGRETKGESITAAALGARIGLGVDLSLGERAVLGVSAGYHLMTDFPDPIGGQENHSGPDIGLSIGLLLGGSGDQTK
jgi:hypothetical protein